MHVWTTGAHTLSRRSKHAPRKRGYVDVQGRLLPVLVDQRRTLGTQLRISVIIKLMFVYLETVFRHSPAVA